MTRSPALRAVSIAVPRFPGTSFDDLPFAAARAEALAWTLRSLGYECATHIGVSVTSARMREIVSAELERGDPDGVLLVHVLTHGEEAARGIIYAVGSDGARADDVEHWFRTAQLRPDSPRTLFLLDLCYSGTLARLPWHTGVSSAENRAWVIAACQPDHPAFDGRFTEALTEVLGDVAAGRFDMEPGRTHVPFSDVARAVRRRVIRLSREGMRGQQVTSTALDASEDVHVPPFFPNPARPGRAVTGTRPGRGRATDEGGTVDRHFLDLLSGIGFGDGWIGAGRFTGRSDELRRLVPWAGGRGPGDLGMVTGGPGCGKSALVSVLVCAAHPSLFEAALPLLEGVAPLPPVATGGIAAVHARQRGPAAVVAAVNEQLGAQSGLPPSSTPGELVSRILGLPVPPLIVVDGLDEADDGVAIMNELILPLSATPRPDGRHAARVLVGGRGYREYQPIVARAHALGTLVDLDDVDRTVLRGDLSRYVFGLLEDVPEYRPHGAARGAFAGEVAEALTGIGSRGRCGEFLVAGLYTRHLVDSTAGSPVTDPAEARHLAAGVPRTLPGVLEVYLRARRGTRTLLEPCLSVLAHAKGEGMPISVLSRVLTARLGPAREPEYGELLETLHACSAFLRQSSDRTGGSSLYRLFHQELADHLAAGFDGTSAGGSVAAHLDRDMTAMLSALGPPDARDWEAAEPYLVRHALQHAEAVGRANELLADPEFLLAAEPTTLSAAPPASPPATAADGSEERGDDLAGIVVGLPARGVATPAARREALALSAARAGLRELARRAAVPPGGPAMAWRPVWAAGVSGPAGPAARRAEAALADFELPRGRKKHRITLLSAVPGGGTVVGADADGWLTVWDTVARQLHHPPFPAHRGTIYALACGEAGGRSLAITAGEDGRVRVWNPDTGKPDPAWPGEIRGFFRSLAFTRVGGRDVVVLASRDGWLQSRDALTGEVVAARLGRGLGNVTSVACVRAGGRDVAVTTAGDGRVVLTDLATGEPMGTHRTAHRGSAHAAVCLESPDRSLAVTVGGGGTLRIWELGSGLTLAGRADAGAGAAEFLAGVLDDGVPVAVTAGRDGNVLVWDVAEGHQVDTSPTAAHPGGVRAVALTWLHGRLAVITAGNDGVLRVSDLSGCRAGLSAGPRATAPARAGARIDRMTVTDDGMVALGHTGGVLLVRPRDGVVLGEAASGPGGLETREDGPEATVAPDDPHRIRLPQTAEEAAAGVVLGRQETPVTALAVGTLNGVPVVFSGDAAGTVRVWDPVRREVVAHVRVPAGVIGLATPPGGPLLVNSSGEVIAFRYVPDATPR